jgi:hypothetical protein
MVRVAIAAAVVALAGCKDLGVRGSANGPLGVARTRPAAFWSYQAVNPAQRKAYEGLTGERFTVGDQSFIVEFPDFAGPRSMLRSVGPAGYTGAAFALAWDQPPYDELYVASGSQRLHVAPAIWK